MNCFIWILLLLGCCGNCSNGNNYNYENTDCGCNYNRCNCNRCTCNRCTYNGCDDECDNGCDNLIQPRVVEDCGCNHHHHHHGNDCVTPPPVPRYVAQEDNCGCNNQKKDTDNYVLE